LLQGLDSSRWRKAGFGVTLTNAAARKTIFQLKNIFVRQSDASKWAFVRRAQWKLFDNTMKLGIQTLTPMYLR
jgi:hypothetical protein